MGFPVMDEEIGDLGIGRSTQARHGGLLERDCDLGTKQAYEQVAIGRAARGREREESNGREPFGLGRGIVLEQGAGGGPERREGLLEIESLIAMRSPASIDQ